MKLIPFFSYHVKTYIALVLLYYTIMLDCFFHLKQKCLNSILSDYSKQTNKQKKRRYQS